jgi:hypothetical protein
MVYRVIENLLHLIKLCQCMFQLLLDNPNLCCHTIMVLNLKDFILYEDIIIEQSTLYS